MQAHVEFGFRYPKSVFKGSEIFHTDWSAIAKGNKAIARFLKAFVKHCVFVVRLAEILFGLGGMGFEPVNQNGIAQVWKLQEVSSLMNRLW